MSGFVNRVSNSPTEANYGGPSMWVGARFTAVAGVTTNFDYAITSDMKLFSGTFRPGTTAAQGDRISFAIVDVDGVIAPPGTVMKEYVDGLYCVADERRCLQSGQSADIVAGLYLRTIYESVGAADVDILVDWQFFEVGT